jgi:hypothetical protein
MINSKEIRKGSLVNFIYNTKDNPLTVTIEQVLEEDAQFVDLKGQHRGSYLFHFFSGILLTIKWLQNMGFTVETFEGEDEALVYLHGLFVAVSFNKKTNSLKALHAPKARPFRFVHELQNYYLDVTGEELTIKETV